MKSISTMLPECLSTPYTHIRVLRNHRDQMVCTTGFVKRDVLVLVCHTSPEILESVHSLKSTSTEAQKYLEQWLKSTSNNGSKDLVTFFNGEALVFRPLKTGDYVDGTQVVCPRCQKTVPRKKAKNHCRRCEEITGEFQESIVDEDNDGAHQTDAIVGSQRPHSDIEDTTDIWTSLCVNTREHERLCVSHQWACNDPHPEAPELVRSILPEPHKILKVDDDQGKVKVKAAKLESQFLETHEPATPEHLPVIGAGGDEGLERLMGAVIVAGENSLTITCRALFKRQLDRSPCRITRCCSIKCPNRRAFHSILQPAKNREDG
ncbi:hypothetical protein BCR41DRAFT_411379 [Lobosporangium transversale]|uniref:Uncharacterized protein n=1 Tax=Lobosporangium transversale TaxID=64571 RepID=A0A1Y2GE47_9FUNG|nr:hypothetical protein BCR41DRAFT_411379 [Lobosporangium transversale]ORZ08270.1 hypothetical protein BCR41DRAFT_411379 [Lobosporangium transversale]|eukprot:XP_021878353.1 hypothetical protein BCR41DRAFT_411379 [Lobosporangium transversale]